MKRPAPIKLFVLGLLLLPLHEVILTRPVIMLKDKIEVLGKGIQDFVKVLIITNNTRPQKLLTIPILILYNKTTAFQLGP
jgi:hypothetical protein